MLIELPEAFRNTITAAFDSLFGISILNQGFNCNEKKVVYKWKTLQKTSHLVGAHGEDLTCPRPG